MLSKLSELKSVPKNPTAPTNTSVKVIMIPQTKENYNASTH
jgi:hypothetical protein